MGQCRPQPRNAVIPPNEILDSHLRWRRALDSGAPVALESTIEALHGCSLALRQIGEELAHLGYPVTDVILPSDSDLASVVERIERKTRQRIPAVLVEFWKIVGGVSFVDLDAYAHVDFWGDVGVEAEYCDGLRVDACTSEWADYIIDDYGDREEQGELDEYPFIFDLSPDGYHKDDISGGSPYGIRSGNDWLPTFEDFNWGRRPLSAMPGPPDFLGYLRSAVLECAGFPGLFGDRAFEPIRERLLRGIQLF
jgi:hypothetical protein